MSFIQKLKLLPVIINRYTPLLIVVANHFPGIMGNSLHRLFYSCHLVVHNLHQCFQRYALPTHNSTNSFFNSSSVSSPRSDCATNSCAFDTAVFHSSVLIFFLCFRTFNRLQVRSYSICAGLRFAFPRISLRWAPTFRQVRVVSPGAILLQQQVSYPFVSRKYRPQLWQRRGALPMASPR